MRDCIFVVYSRQYFLVSGVGIWTRHAPEYVVGGKHEVIFKTGRMYNRVQPTRRYLTEKFDLQRYMISDKSRPFQQPRE